MGIRTLHRRMAPAQANVDTEAAPSPAPPSVSPLAAGASTARIPVGRRAALWHTAAGLCRRLASRAQGWAELARSYLALALTLLPRPRPTRTLTVSVATVGPLSEPPDGSAPYRPYPHRRRPGPDATP
ncbi:hypothetical protein [Streptomyces viridochromogenes]|uniref:hypothetical protein n=1 Tax=Streptomyces viridochromogenes TaxID=1938 RepID=UPI000560D623|nr:hypothetical protein [Streptomyces viridochromogenes]